MQGILDITILGRVKVLAGSERVHLGPCHLLLLYHHPPSDYAAHSTLLGIPETQAFL